MTPRLILKNKKNLSLQDFYERRNKVLIKRGTGGFGDILMQRMMFEDFSKTNLEIHYTCPYPFIQFAFNHPFLNNVKEMSQVKESDYGVIYDITTVCAKTETILGSKNNKHRSDIWAKHCGVELTNHEMYLNPDPVQVEICKKILNEINPENKKIVVLSTKSTDTDFGKAKSLTDKQIVEIVEYLRKEDIVPITIDKQNQAIYDLLKVEQFVDISPQKWIALVSLSDYVISVDTATFHLAGGLKRPLVGIFSFTDGKIYGKYFDFVLVQKHRDEGNWDCGPCFVHTSCTKDSNNVQKPCITELKTEEIIKGFNKARKNDTTTSLSKNIRQRNKN